MAENNKDVSKLLKFTMWGNFLEFYDYYIVYSMLTIISVHFFPAEDEFASLLNASAFYLIAYLARPIGGFFFGSIGDKKGRGSSVSSSILLMFIPSAIICILPTYNSIGVLAPILLILMRVIQSFSVGGEFAISMILIAESVDPKRRNFYVNCVGVAAEMGLLCSSFVVLILRNMLGTEAFAEWGWRIPFIISLPMGVYGLYLKKNIAREMKHYSLDEISSEGELFVEKKRYFWIVTYAILFFGFCFVCHAVKTRFVVDFSTRVLNQDLSHGLVMKIVGVLSMCCAELFTGIMADRYCVQKMCIIGHLSMLLVAFPFLSLLSTGIFLYQITGVIMFSWCLGMCWGSSNFIMRFFPRNIRCRMFSTCYALAAMLFSSNAAFLFLFIVDKTGSVFGVGLYVLILCLASLLMTVIFYRKKNALHEN